MRKMLFQMYDRAGRCMIGPILTERVEAPAIRMISDAFRDPKSLFHNHPGDYELHVLGEYDDSDGRILIGSGEYPRCVITGVAIMEAMNGAES